MRLVFYIYKKRLTIKIAILAQYMVYRLLGYL